MAEKVRSRFAPDNSGDITGQGLAPHIREAIRMSAPQERTNTPSRRMAETVSQRLIAPGRRLSESQRMRGGMEPIAESFCDRLIETWRRGQWQVLGNDGVNFDEVHERVVSEYQGTRFGDSFRAVARGQWDRRLAENVSDGIGISQYQRYLDTVTRMGTLEFCQEISVAPVLGLIGRVNVDCSQRTLAGKPHLVDIRRELGPMAETETTPFFGLGDPPELDLPDRYKMKFAYAMTREAVCQGIDSFLREVMAQGAVQFDWYWAPEIIQAMFDLYATPQDNPWPFTLNKTQWRSFYQLQADADKNKVPYENLLYNNLDISAARRGLFIAAEILFDEQTDFTTGRPVSCGDSWNIIATGRQQLTAIQEALGVMTVSQASGGPGNEVIEFGRTGRDGWQTRAFNNIWIKRYLNEFYSLLQPGYNRAQRTQVIDRSMVLGNPNRAMGMQVEWDVEEIDMPTGWTDFNQEIIYGKKWLQKAGLYWANPQHIINVKGLVGNTSAPDANPNPIS